MNYPNSNRKIMPGDMVETGFDFQTKAVIIEISFADVVILRHYDNPNPDLDFQTKIENCVFFSRIENWATTTRSLPESVAIAVEAYKKGVHYE